MEKKFVNAQEMAKKHPDSFEVPSQLEIDCLKIGDYVKVCVDKERFWNEVIDITPNWIYAKVANELIHVDLRQGNIIRFQNKHIYDIIKKSKGE